MISEVVMPTMGADMKEGTILRWLKQEGDQVNRGEAIAEIETDKANIEIEAFGGGVFRKVLEKEGAVVPVGTVIAVIAGAEEDLSKYEGGSSAAASSQTAPAPAGPDQTAATQTAAPSNQPVPDSTEPPAMPASDPSAAPAGSKSAAVASPPAAPSADGRLRISPVARKAAEAAGIDPSSIQGTGPDGRIVLRDVESARSAAPAVKPAASTTSAAPQATFLTAPRGEDQVQDLPLSRMRQAIARTTQRAKQEAPHYYLGIDIDMTEVMKLRAEMNKALGDTAKITVNDIVIQATTRTLVQHPHFNAYWIDEHVQLHSQINIGIAVALDDGLVAPSLMDAAYKGLVQISHEAKDVAERARSGRLSPDEYTAATFSISNVGSYGVDEIVAIITPPQVAVLGVGAVKEHPVVRDGEVVVRQMMHVYLSADHRATDGADGARFLQTLKRNLESPGMMLL